ncbi:glycoside hydrolase family 28 protein [Verrucomicrobia bacterium S94]|nr:glycoside hydrolase family 28 protein [Verrucomicrobia bacterium S94]
MRNLIALLLGTAMTASAYIHDIRDYGAIGDGKTLCTAAVQKAIDKASANGGGEVLVTAGSYMIGTIYMKDNVTLHITGGSKLIASPNIRHFATNTHKNMYKNEPHMDRCLIFARGVHNIAFKGSGAIDGNGAWNNFNQETGRPMMIRLMNCTNIRMHDLTLKNPAAWTSAWLYCRDIVVEGITVISRVNNNGDGLDFDGCERVRVSNCTFDTSDDSICLQASRKDKACRDVVISNCIFVSKWAGIRIGLLSLGDFENVTVNNCIFRDIEDAGLKIQMCEGGTMKNMTFSNLVMSNVPRPVFMTFGQQRCCVDTPKGELQPMKEMKGFVFDGIQIDSSACGKDSAIVITGMPGHPIKDIVFSDVQMTTGGGGTAADAANKLKELTPDVLEGWWPEYSRLGATVPAFGIYARHVDGLVLNNMHMKTAKPDARPATKFVDVKNLTENP